MSLRVRKLSVAYGRIDVLHDVTVAVNPGAVTVVVGPNAAGKSTLLRCMIGVHRPRLGCVELDGRAVHEMRPRELARRVVYVPQRSNVAASFTVREVVALGRYSLERNEKRIDEALEALDLVGVRDRVFQTLSVGQQQRVMLARAVGQVEARGFMLLDEPTAAMDLQHIAATAHVLQTLARSGVGVVVASHDLSLASDLADDAWVLVDGVLVASGPAREVLTLPRLSEVFGVGFDLWEREGRRPVLVPRIVAG